MASRKSVATVEPTDEQLVQMVDNEVADEEPAAPPYDLEPLNDQTRRIVLQWGQATMNRVAELKMSGANEWARFLEEIFNTVGIFVEEQ